MTVPVIADMASDLYASSAQVMTCVRFGVSMSPWAVRQANHLDVVMHTGFFFVLLLAAHETGGVDDAVVVDLLLAVLLAVMFAFQGV